MPGGVALLLVPGTLVDRYRVETEIGRGGMARVYRVRHKNLDTLHALKVLTVGGEELRHRLLREGKLQSQLDHPNIVPVRDVIDLPEGPALLMDYIDGCSLDRWLLEERPDPAERERVFLEILDGVAFAHARDVIHRDLKPSNVMMEHKRGAWHPRVADFGLAKSLGGTEDEGVLQSRTGRPMGTPAYMSPEQVRSAKGVDHRADVFALGCILYELVCDQRAFVGEDSLEVFNRVTQGRFRAPRDVVRGLPPRLESAIFGALAIDVDERIPNCETLARVVRGELPWARPSAVDATLDGSQFDHEPVAAPAVAGQTLALRGTVTLLPGAAVVDASAAPERPPSRAGWVVGGLALIALIALIVAAALWTPRPEPTGATTPAPPAAAPSAAPPAVPPAAPAAVLPPTPVVAPVAPVAAPAAPPVATPAAPPVAAPPSRAGDVRFTGDAQGVQLRTADGQRFPAGEVPPGSYLIEASFDSGPPMHAGNLVIRAGQRVTLDCRSSTLSCSPR